MSDLQHVIRPNLPWRAERQTECGLDAAGRDVITQDEFAAKVRGQGQQRSAMTTCMTCWHTASRNQAWSQSPQSVMRRHIGAWSDDDPRMNAELEAIAALIHAHREEFDGYLAGIGQTVDIAAARRSKRNRQSAHQFRGLTL